MNIGHANLPSSEDSWRDEKLPAEERERLYLRSINNWHPNDGNWWCPLPIEEVEGGARHTLIDAYYHINLSKRGLWSPEWESITSTTWPSRPILGDAAALREARDRRLAENPILALVDRDELAALAAVDDAPKLLADRAVAEAKGITWYDRLLGWDADIPEALHLAVRATRWGCRRNGTHAPHSRAAFKALHDGFGDSPWAARTPYWFGCAGFRRECTPR